jgi:HEAT repeat protein
MRLHPGKAGVTVMKNYQPTYGIKHLLLTFALVLLLASAGPAARAQSDVDENGTPSNAEASAAVARGLASSDPLERQHAAEELARVGAVEQLKLVEGYRLQEKDARVRLALDWALYRMGKTETLFSIVRSLNNSSRRNQATTYLKQLEGPESLYFFLDRVEPETLVYLLEALASLGNAETVGRLESYTTYLDERIVNAAKFAIREIERRETQTQARPTRPRQTGIAVETKEIEDAAPEEESP